MELVLLCQFCSQDFRYLISTISILEVFKAFQNEYCSCHGEMHTSGSEPLSASVFFRLLHWKALVCASAIDLVYAAFSVTLSGQLRNLFGSRFRARNFPAALLWHGIFVQDVRDVGVVYTKIALQGR